jgi:hypothetical protein
VAYKLGFVFFLLWAWRIDTLEWIVWWEVVSDRGGLGYKRWL